MALVIFLVAILAWAILRHQHRRHAVELAAECDRLGCDIPEPPPAVPTLESVLTVLVGVAFVVLCAAVLSGVFASGDPEQWKAVWQFASVGLAAGAALITVGIRSLAAMKRTSETKRLGHGPPPPNAS